MKSNKNMFFSEALAYTTLTAYCLFIQNKLNNHLIQCTHYSANKNQLHHLYWWKGTVLKLRLCQKVCKSLNWQKSTVEQPWLLICSVPNTDSFTYKLNWKLPNLTKTTDTYRKPSYKLFWTLEGRKQMETPCKRVSSSPINVQMLEYIFLPEQQPF